MKRLARIQLLAYTTLSTCHVSDSIIANIRCRLDRIGSTSAYANLSFAALPCHTSSRSLSPGEDYKIHNRKKKTRLPERTVPNWEKKLRISSSVVPAAIPPIKTFRTRPLKLLCSYSIRWLELLSQKRYCSIALLQNVHRNLPRVAWRFLL